MDFFEKTGKVAIGSRLRMLTETFTHDASDIYHLYGIDFKPKWFPVFYSLMDEQPKGITAIAKEIGQSHPSVSTIVKEMLAQGLLSEITDALDRRKSLVTLSNRGKEAARKLIVQLRDVDRAVGQLMSESKYNLWDVVAEYERLLSERSLLARVRDIKSERESAGINIVSYKPEHQGAFKELNRQWIESFWQLEPHDIEVLDNPDEKIIAKGGHIFVALYDGKPVGVCALCKMDKDSGYDYELAKLAVSPQARRKGIGIRLCEHVKAKAIELGATTLFLESNTRLKSAIALYRKLGFKELEEYHPAYARGDIQMELKL